MDNYQIIPSPGTQIKDWETMEQKIELIKPFAKNIHIDIINGIFAPNNNLLDPTPFLKYKDDFLMEVHLMVDDPLKYLDSFAKAGFKKFIGQIEKMKNLDEFVAKAQNLGEVGLALDLDTPVDTIIDYIQDLDFIFLMSVKAGFSGQEFDPKVLDKIKKIREVDDLIPIGIDGGINDQTLPLALDAGANRFVATSFIFKAENSSENFHLLEGLCEKHQALEQKR